MIEVTRREFLAGSIGALALGAMPRLQESSEITAAERRLMAETAEAFMKKYEVPGLSLAIANHGKISYAEGFGFADRDAGEKVAPHHLFRVASVSKPFTSAAIFQLIEKEKLRLEDKVFGREGVLGEEFGAGPTKKHVEQIEIRHLLTHTCGGWPNDGSDPMFSHIKMNHKQLITWALENVALTHEPGSHFAYSNFGYCVLGRVIEKRTGKSYEAHVRESVLAPCGIKNMRIAGNTLKDREKNEVVYYGQNGENPYDMNVRRMDSHGGWLATPTDLVEFLLRVDGFPTVADLLREETIKKMTTATKAEPGYASGWAVNRFNNWWHNGSLPGTSTLMVRTHSQFCWAALANTRRPNSKLDGDLDQLMWEIAGKVKAWRP